MVPDTSRESLLTHWERSPRRRIPSQGALKELWKGASKPNGRCKGLKGEGLAGSGWQGPRVPAERPAQRARDEEESQGLPGALTRAGLHPGCFPAHGTQGHASVFAEHRKEDVNPQAARLVASSRK